MTVSLKTAFEINRARLEGFYAKAAIVPHRTYSKRPMFRVLGCVFEQHDLRLVALAGLLCLFACAAAMSMMRRARVAQDGARTAWLLSAGAVAGTGIWGTH